MIETIKDMSHPSNIAALLLLSGVIMALFARLRAHAQRFLIAGSLVYLVFANGLVATQLISPLEYRYKALVAPELPSRATTVVILTAYAAADPEMPVSSRPGTAALYRVVEAARLYREGGIDELILSGDQQAGDVMYEALVALGIPTDRILVDSDAAHTSDSAQSLSGRLDGAPFYLVTSAGHMPRAIASLRAVGLDPLPAPTDHRLPADPGLSSFSPSPTHLAASDLAVHEYLGLAWYRLSGKTSSYW